MPKHKKIVTGPKILFWDIETSLSIVTTFSLRTDYISHESLLQDWNILSVSWKFQGDKKVQNIRVGKDVQDDKKLVQKIRDVVAGADIIVHHNGNKFDLKKLNTRIIYHGLPPLPGKLLTVDTLVEARRAFAFTSNRLDYICRFLGIEGKTETSHGLWSKVLKGDQAALKEMAQYNDNDVLILEALYDKMLPYIRHPNMGAFYDADSMHCPNCGDVWMHKSGTRATREGNTYQRYKCNSCGAWAQGKTALTKTRLKT